MAYKTVEIDLVGYEGATFEQDFTWKTGDPPSAVDLTGYSGTCHIRDRIPDETPVFELESGTGVVIKDQDSDTGGYRLYIPNSDTEGKCPNHRERRMVYDLRLTDPDGDVRLHQHGTFILKPAVTRPWET